jgi:hypothetical protein
MKIYIQYEPMPLAVFENFYSDFEVSQITSELKNMSSLFLPPEQTGSASINFELLKQNKGLWLDHNYPNIKTSSIIKYSNKIFDSRLLSFLESSNKFWRLLRTSNWDNTLVSAYGYGDFYNPHSDTGTFTFITYILDNEQAYLGGDLFFQDFDRVLQIKNNLGVLFPGSYMHSVSTISPTPNHETSGNSAPLRYSITKFIGHKVSVVVPPTRDIDDTRHSD